MTVTKPSSALMGGQGNPNSPTERWKLKDACEYLVHDKLTELDLSGRALTVARAKTLAEALKNNKSLKVLNLSKAHIGKAELKVLGPALSHHPALTSLFLRGNQINHTSIEIVKNIVLSNENVKKLDLSQNKLGEESLRIFCSIQQKYFLLTSVYLGMNPLGRRPKMLRVFFPLLSRTLTRLDLTQFQQKPVESKEYRFESFGGLISRCENLRYLNLTANNIEYTAFSDIVDALRHRTTLRTLLLSNNPLLCGVRREMETSVDSDGNSNSYWVTRYYPNKYSGLTNLFQVLQKGHPLSRLELNNLFKEPYSQEALFHLTKLVECPNLMTLGLLGPKLSPMFQYQLQMKVSSLKKNMVIRFSTPTKLLSVDEVKVDLSMIERLGMNAKGKEESIQISDLKLSILEWRQLGLALKGKHSLKEFSISGVDLSKSDYIGLAHIAIGALSLSKLNTLRLTHANVGDVAMPLFATLLHNNRSITSLDLSSNKITGVGLKDFFCSLEGVESSLKMLNLAANPLHLEKLKPEVRREIKDSLYDNRSLQQLDLSRSNSGSKKLKEQCLDMFEKPLKQNRSLTVLKLEGYKLEEPVQTNLEAQLKNNKERPEKEKEPIQKKQRASEKKEAPKKWNVRKLDPHKYEVSVRNNPKQMFNVRRGLFGKLICSCQENECEHIRLVLERFF